MIAFRPKTSPSQHQLKEVKTKVFLFSIFDIYTVSIKEVER